MAQYLVLLKYLPTVLAVIKAVSELVSAIQSKLAKEKKENFDTAKENRTIDEKRKELTTISYDFLPETFKAKATAAELEKFQEDALAVVIAVQKAIESVKALMV